MRLDAPSTIFSALAGLSSGLIWHGYYPVAALASFVAMAVLADIVVVRLRFQVAAVMATDGPLRGTARAKADVGPSCARCLLSKHRGRFIGAV